MNGMVLQVKLTKDQIKEAIELASLIPENIKNSDTNGKYRILGSFGEVALKYTINGLKYANEVKGINNFKCDLVDHIGRKIEVKSKSFFKIPIKYDCTIRSSSEHQSIGNESCDLYMFCWIHVTGNQQNPEKVDVYIVGSLTPEEAFKKAILYKKGDTDPKDEKFTFYQDRWQIENKYLKDIESYNFEIDRKLTNIKFFPRHMILDETKNKD